MTEKGHFTWWHIVVLLLMSVFFFGVNRFSYLFIVHICQDAYHTDKLL